MQKKISIIIHVPHSKMHIRYWTSFDEAMECGWIRKGSLIFINMKKKLKRNGFYIPQHIFELTDINWSNKVVLSEIYHILEHNKTCFASNKHFGELLSIGGNAASKQIKKLRDLGYIETQNVHENNAIVGRYIKYLGTNTDKIETKPVDKETTNNTADSSSTKNDGVVPNNNEGSSDSTREVLPEEQRGSYNATTGVVPKQQEGSSTGNINKPTNNSFENNIHNSIDELDHIILNIEDVIESYSFISKIYKDRPDRLADFKEAFQKYINKEYPMSELLEGIRWCFNNKFNNWKFELKRLGFNQFVWKLQDYHDGYPDTTALMLATIIRVLQQERSDDN